MVSVLVMTYFLLRDYNTLPKKELHWSPWVYIHHKPTYFLASTSIRILEAFALVEASTYIHTYVMNIHIISVCVYIYIHIYKYIGMYIYIYT